MQPSPRIDCSANIPITQDEKQFFKALEARIAELCKANGLLIGRRTLPPPSGDRPRRCCSNWSAFTACPKSRSACSCR